MSRKDYVLIADAIAKQLAQYPSFVVPGTRESAAKGAVLLTMDAIAAALAKDNPRFSPSRFKNACLGEE